MIWKILFIDNKFYNRNYKLSKIKKRYKNKMKFKINIIKYYKIEPKIMFKENKDYKMNKIYKINIY